MFVRCFAQIAEILPTCLIIQNDAEGDILEWDQSKMRLSAV